MVASSSEDALSPKQSCGAEAVVRSGERVREFGRGGVVRFDQVVVVIMHGPDVLRRVVEVKRDLVLAPLVERVLRYALRRCH